MGQTNQPQTNTNSQITAPNPPQQQPSVQIRGPLGGPQDSTTFKNDNLARLHKELKNRKKKNLNKFLQAMMSIPKQGPSELNTIIIPFNIWDQTFIDPKVEEYHPNSAIFRKITQNQLTKILQNLEKEVSTIKVWVNFPSFVRKTLVLFFTITVALYCLAAWVTKSIFVINLALLCLVLLIVLCFVLNSLLIDFWEDSLVSRQSNIRAWLQSRSSRHRILGVRLIVGAFGSFIKVIHVSHYQRDLPTEDKTQGMNTPQSVLQGAVNPGDRMAGVELGGGDTAPMTTGRNLGRVVELVEQEEEAGTTRTRGGESSRRLLSVRSIGNGPSSRREGDEG